jgi:hypothetical protein
VFGFEGAGSELAVDSVMAEGCRWGRLITAGRGTCVYWDKVACIPKINSGRSHTGGGGNVSF